VAPVVELDGPHGLFESFLVALATRTEESVDAEHPVV
jgi:hypothetical protein